MKQTRKLVNWLVACAVVFAMATSATAQSNKERTGKVARIKGSARYSTGNNIWQPLKVGTVLRAPAVVQTAKDSYVDIVFNESDSVPRSTPRTSLSNRPVAEQDIVRVSADSVLAIDKLTAVETGADKVTETQLDLRSGRILGSVKKMSAASRFEVKIPNGVAGVRGTLFGIDALGIVYVGEGSVVVGYMKGTETLTQVVPQGYQFDTRTGELTRMSEMMMQLLNAFGLEGLVYFTAPTIFVDRTILYVSPVEDPSPSPSPGGGTGGGKGGGGD